MSYSEALKAAGATVHDSKFTGDYQGTWVALVTYNGTTGFASGSFGSCSYCDSFQAFQDESGYEPTPEQLADFGRGYLDNIESIIKVRSRYMEQSEWDSEAEGTIRWLDQVWGKFQASTFKTKQKADLKEILDRPSKASADSLSLGMMYLDSWKH
jgi:hypothetical protein